MAQPVAGPDSQLPLSPAVFHILMALSDAERHGYGIMLEVAERTNDKVRLGPGTLYGSIKRMIRDRLIEESGDRPDPEFDDDRRRRYYRLTDLGHRVLLAEVERLKTMLKIARAKKLVARTEGLANETDRTKTLTTRKKSLVH